MASTSKTVLLATGVGLPGPTALPGGGCCGYVLVLMNVRDDHSGALNHHAVLLPMLLGEMFYIA
eukprot:2017915-Pyramimonas_sp.AAC.2